MDVIFSLLQNVLEEGFIYGIVAMGVYITYKILDFPDLSVDGTFPLGCAVTAAMIVAASTRGLPALHRLLPVFWRAASQACSMSSCG